jgi:hypothetical protein
LRHTYREVLLVIELEGIFCYRLEIDSWKLRHTYREVFRVIELEGILPSLGGGPDAEFPGIGHSHQCPILTCLRTAFFVALPGPPTRRTSEPP